MDESSDKVQRRNSNNYEPKTLFTLCIEYISSNISFVESLEDFPGVIGEEIFKYCLFNGCFSENSRATEHAIKLFVNAYGSDFINSLSIKTQKILSEFGECLCILCLPVTKLDLRNCLLGNNSDILRVFVEMSNLQVLNLANNELSDDGFRVILARHIMFKTGFQSLDHLDISDNIVSLRVLKSVLSLPSLKSLRISIAATVKAINPQITKNWDDIVRQKCFTVSQANTEVAGNIGNDGWGSKIIQIWEDKAAEWEIQRLEKLEKKSKGFYGKALKKARLGLKTARPEYETYETFTYRKPNNENFYLENKNQTGSDAKHEKRLSIQSDRGQQPLSAMNGPSDEELELLRMYMKK